MGVEFAVFENCYERSQRRNSACGNPRIKLIINLSFAEAKFYMCIINIQSEIYVNEYC